MKFLMIMCGLFMCSCGYVNQYLGIKDDNIGEEIAEEVIKKETGLDVDLTPGSPE